MELAYRQLKKWPRCFLVCLLPLLLLCSFPNPGNSGNQPERVNGHSGPIASDYVLQKVAYAALARALGDQLRSTQDEFRASDVEKRRSAAAALVKLGPAAIPELPTLIRASAQDSMVAASVRSMLEKFEDKGLRHLLKALEDPDVKSRIASLRLLGLMASNRSRAGAKA